MSIVGLSNFTLWEVQFSYPYSLFCNLCVLFGLGTLSLYSEMVYGSTMSVIHFVWKGEKSVMYLHLKVQFI